MTLKNLLTLKTISNSQNKLHSLTQKTLSDNSKLTLYSMFIRNYKNKLRYKKINNKKDHKYFKKVNKINHSVSSHFLNMIKKATPQLQKKKIFNTIIYSKTKEI